MKHAARERGITLIVSLIMLMVLSLIVVSAIRFGNINLQIAGNVQSQSEASAATQIAIERVLEKVKTASSIESIAAFPAAAPQLINAGGASYKVASTAPVCLLKKPVSNADLDPAKAADIPCFESQDQDKQETADGQTTTSPSACNDQRWAVEATVQDDTTGANVTTVQGFAVRVSAQVKCP